MASDDSEEDEIGDSDWISANDGKENREEMPLCNSSSSEEELGDQPCSSASANYFVPKPLRSKQHFLQIMLVVQLHIVSFGKVQERQGLQNLSAQK